MAQGCTVKDLLRRIDSAELSEWMALNAIEPFTYDADDYRFAVLSCIIANANRAAGSRPFKVKDFMLCEDTSKKPVMSGDDIKNLLMGLTKKPKGKK